MVARVPLFTLLQWWLVASHSVLCVALSSLDLSVLSCNDGVLYNKAVGHGIVLTRGMRE